MAEQYEKLAEYFERRVKRARRDADRERLIMAATKYRLLASEKQPVLNGNAPDSVRLES